jgi:hypothetical protein
MMMSELGIGKHVEGIRLGFIWYRTHENPIYEPSFEPWYEARTPVLRQLRARKEGGSDVNSRFL